MIVGILQESTATAIKARKGKSRDRRRLASGGDPLTEGVKMTVGGGEGERRVFADKSGGKARNMTDEA